MNGTKSIFKSKGVWGGVIAVGAGIFGINITELDMKEITDNAELIVASVGGLVAVYGRITATTKIGG